MLSIDNDHAAAETHAANFACKTICEDLELWLASGSKVPRADVVIGGPPCQGFSLLNKKRVGDKRRALWEPFLDVVKRSKARIFVMENVVELHGSPEFLSIRRRAKRMGFEVDAGVLNAADYGTPQTRRRTVIIGWNESLVEKPQFPPSPTHANPSEQSKLPRWRTVRDVIANLPAHPNGTDIGDKAPLDLHFGRTPTPVSLQRYAAVPPGGNRFDLQRKAPEITPRCWIKKTSGGTDLFGRLWWDRPSVTIRTEFFKPEKGRYLHPIENRPITHREAARLMGFPDDFVFKGTKVEIARQIGNAVPPALAHAVAEVVHAALEASRIKGGTQVEAA